MSVFDRVRDVIAEELNVSAEQITPEATFADDLGADSLDIVELVMRLEDEFDVSIPDEDAEKIRTVGDAVAYIEQKATETES